MRGAAQTLLGRALAGAALLALGTVAVRAAGDPTVAALQQTDGNHDGVLSQAEVAAGLRRQLGLPAGQDSNALQAARRKFAAVFGPGPTYPVQDLAAHPYFNEKIFGLAAEAAAPEKVNTTDRWVRVDPHPFKLRRTFDDFLEPDKTAAKGAIVSYTNDLNGKTEQWAFHGVVGLNFDEKINVHYGEDAKGIRPEVDTSHDAGVTERWLVPSVQWDKITTSKTDQDEIDSLIYRLTTGFLYSGERLTRGLLDGFRFNFSGGYATDSSHRSGILSGEIDLIPVKIQWESLGFGVNSTFQRIGWFGIRPELTLHAEGGTVSNDGGLAKLVAQEDFLRLGGKAGVGIRVEQVTGRFHALRGLFLHAGLNYLVDVTSSGPNVDLVTASADWALDDKGDYTLSVEYRNGRAPLVLDRYHDVTAGFSVRF